jgi:small-conductance mechanosensitive channel
MYSVEADRAKRLIVISAAGRVTAQEVKEVAQQVREIVKDAPPGFHVLTDFRWLEAMEPASAHYIGEIMDALAAKEVGSIVRVVPDPHKDIGLNILSQFHYGAKIRVMTFESLAEALQLLTEEVTGQQSKLGDQNADNTATDR